MNGKCYVFAKYVITVISLNIVTDWLKLSTSNSLDISRLQGLYIVEKLFNS